jgi:nucleoside-diphosphate-sugar epimerase
MEAAVGQVFNIGTARETSIRELAGLVQRASGSDVPIEYVPYEQEYGPHFQDTRRRVPDVQKAARLLGFRADISLEDGVERTLAWWRERLGRVR